MGDQVRTMLLGWECGMLSVDGNLQPCWAAPHPTATAQRIVVRRDISGETYEVDYLGHVFVDSIPTADEAMWLAEARLLQGLASMACCDPPDADARQILDALTDVTAPEVIAPMAAARREGGDDDHG